MTCKDCGNWCQKLGGAHIRDGKEMDVGLCLAAHRAFPFMDLNAAVYTWDDFPACPYFQRRQDWADKAMKRLEDFIFADMKDKNLNLAWVPQEWRDKVMNFFREEAAKAGLK